MTSSRKTPFLYEIEHGENIPVEKLAYLRERCRNRLYNYILKKFLEKKETKKLTQVEVARRIGSTPDVVNRWLGAPGNWTIDTISDLLVGICAEELEPTSSSLLNRSRRNRTQADWRASPILEFLDKHKQDDSQTNKGRTPMDPEKMHGALSAQP